MALKIAVYGSLREGMGNFRIIESAKKLSMEKVSLPLSMFDLGGFPGLVPSDETHDMIVEVYEVDPETYRRVERLEGYPSFYDRQPIETSVGAADIYFLPRGSAWSNAVVTKFDGAYDWVKHLHKKRFPSRNNVSQD